MLGVVRMSHGKYTGGGRAEAHRRNSEDVELGESIRRHLKTLQCQVLLVVSL